MEKSIIDKGQPEHSVVTTCAYCGVGCSFRAEMKGNEVVRMVPEQGRPGEPRPLLREGPLRLGLRDAPDRITKPMIRKKITDPWREVSLGRGDRLRRREFKRIQAKYGRDSDRRHHLVALHQRRDLSSCRSWCAPRSATTTSTPARACAIRLPAMA